MTRATVPPSLCLAAATSQLTATASTATPTQCTHAAALRNVDYADATRRE